MAKDIDLAEAFVEKAKSLEPGEDYTWDDFFKDHGIPKRDRTDFAIGCILKQAKERFGYGKGDV
jgi:hypothetical protein